MRKRTLIGLILLAFCLACRLVPAVAEFYAVHVYPPLSAGLSLFGSAFRFSLEKITVLAFAVTFVDILVKAIHRREGLWRWLGQTTVVAVWLYVWFSMGWGNNYYRPGLYARNGIARVSFEPETFRRFLDDYTAQLNSVAQGEETVDREALEAEIKDFYTDKVTAFGYTRLRSWQHLKRPLLNPLYSAVRVTGFIGPFFCEPQVNLDLLEFEFPYTAAHEMGHLAGVSSEAEASYWGFVFCRQSSNPAVRYSGYVSILPYVASNAAYLLTQDEYQAWLDTLDPKALEDHRRAGEYWDGKQVRWIERLQDWTYNLFLKSHGLSEGVKDYFGVVAMIMTMDAAGVTL